MADTYYKQNHLKKLRAFCQTAKLGSMTKAAESPEHLAYRQNGFCPAQWKISLRTITAFHSNHECLFQQKFGCIMI